jgi:predicted AAA+ superfamily ATPase
VDRLFDDPQRLLRAGKLTREELVGRVVTGGFPDAVRPTPARRRAWFDAYVTTSIQQVVRELADLDRLAELPRLLRLCAARTGTELNAFDVASDFGIPVRTIGGYLAHLATAFFIQLVPAWSTNLSAKVIRRPKLMLVDTGLAARLTGATPATLERERALFGPLLETFVGMELRKLATWADTPAQLYHFRDRSGVEVDFVLEHPDGRVAGIEVKATSTPRHDDFRGLRFLAERLGDRFAYGVVLNAAPEATPFGPKMAALPVDALWR